MRSWDDLGRKVKPFAEVVETFGGQGVVVVLPAELGLEVTAGGEGLAGFDDLKLLVWAPRSGKVGTHKEVLGVNVAMLWEVEVLLGHEYALTEQVLRSVNRCPSKYIWRRYCGADLDGTMDGTWLTLTSWIFLRSAFGINIVASLWRFSGDRVQCRISDRLDVGSGERLVSLQPSRFVWN